MEEDGSELVVLVYIWGLLVFNEKCYFDVVKLFIVFYENNLGFVVLRLLVFVLVGVKDFKMGLGYL